MLGVAAGAHAIHDGFSDLLYVLLPVWQANFGLGYTEIGLLRGCYMGTMSLFQIPAAHLAERTSSIVVLAAGTVLASACFLIAGLSSEFVSLLAALLIGGLGASVQHPIASAIVARAVVGPRSRAALGFYNFAGDIGKVALPAFTAVLFTIMTWRPALWVLAGVGAFAAVLILTLAPQRRDNLQVGVSSTHSVDVVADVTKLEARSEPRPAFMVLLSIALIDSAVRMGFLLFLPFLLQSKGASLAIVGVGLSLIFAGGAAGKLICAYLAARLGVLPTVIVTEGLTTAGIFTLLPVPLEAALLLLPAIGMALNGTSSVLYGTVPDIVASEKMTQAFGIFYTGTAGAAALSPLLFGVLGDRLGVSVAMQVIALFALATMPLAVVLNTSLSRNRSA